MIWASSRVKIPICCFRVVCGQGETAAIFVPNKALINVDLPTLGRPMTATKPDLKSFGKDSMSLFYQRKLVIYSCSFYARIWKFCMRLVWIYCHCLVKW